MFDDGFVGHPTDVGEIGDGAVDGFGGEIAEGEHLVFGEAGGAELLVGAVEELLRGGMGCGACGFEGHRGREGFDHAAMDGGCGFAVQLLIDDGFDEGFKWRLSTGDAHGEGAGTFDELAEFRVCCGEFAAGESVVVARRTWTVEGTRHVLTVSQGTEECLASGGEFGLDWFGFTSAIPMRQGRCSAEFSRGQRCARDVVQAKCG